MIRLYRWRAWVCAVFFGISSLLRGVEPLKKQPGLDEASAVLDRWMHVQGLDRPAAQVFPRVTSQELITGDESRGVKLRFVNTAGREYRLLVELPDGKRYGEMFDSFWGYWHLNEVLGNGHIAGPSELVNMLRNLWRDEAALRKNYGTWRRLPDRERDGKNCHVVGMEPKRGGAEYWWFDAETGVLNVIDTVSSEGKLIGRVRFSDYQLTDGVLEPRVLTNGEGKQRTTLRTESVQNCATLPAGFFAPTKQERDQWQKCEDVLVKYVKACGGIPALSQIVTRVTKSVGENRTNGVKFTVTLSQKSPKSLSRGNRRRRFGPHARGLRRRKRLGAERLERISSHESRRTRTVSTQWSAQY